MPKNINLACLSDKVGVELISSPLSITTAWQDLGSEIPMFGYLGATAFLSFTIGAGADTGLQFQALAKHASAGADEYSFPIKTVGASAVAVEPVVYTFTNDANQKIALHITTNSAVPFLQFQVKKLVDGGGADATVATAHYVRTAQGGE